MRRPQRGSLRAHLTGWFRRYYGITPGEYRWGGPGADGLAFSRGTVMANRVWPGRLVSVTLPSRAATTALTMARPRPGSLLEAGDRAVAADEPVEQVGLQRGRYAGTVVGHRQFHVLRVGAASWTVTVVRRGGARALLSRLAIT